MSNNGQQSEWPCFSDEEIQAVVRVLKSNKVNYWTGDEVKQFEREYAEYFGSARSIAMANGTVVIEGALLAIGIKPGDEVIVTPRTFIASISAIVSVGAIPVFADVDRDSQNVTAETIEKVISNKTKCIICVHLAGWPCEMNAINSLSSERNIEVIEDCAQAHGAYYHGKSVGTLSSIGCWSFCQDKIMTTGGEGGMITTSNSDYADYLWSHKDHGKSWEAINASKLNPSVGFKWVHDQFGTNWRMTEMQAAIGRYQLKQLEQWSSKRLANAESIWNAANELPGVRAPSVPSYIQHAAYKCYLFLELDSLKAGWSRERIFSEFADKNVFCQSGSCSEVYLEKAFEGTSFAPSKRLPVARELGDTSLMFMIHPTMESWELERTCSALKSVLHKAVK